LVPRRITKIVAIRCHILRLKCTKFDFGWGSAQTLLREFTALPRCLSGFKGPTSKGRERREGDGAEKREREGQGWGKGGEVSFPHSKFLDRLLL